MCVQQPKCMVPMPALPNTQHEKFVLELLSGKSQADAYMAAGYKAKSTGVASAAATRLLKDTAIQQRITELQTKAADKTALTKSWVIEKLIENVERAMTAEPVRDKDGNAIGDYSYNGSVANRALELLGKEQGMFIDKKEVGKPGDFQHLDDDALDTEIKRMVAADPELATLMKVRAPRGATKH